MQLFSKLGLCYLAAATATQQCTEDPTYVHCEDFGFKGKIPLPFEKKLVVRGEAHTENLMGCVTHLMQTFSAHQHDFTAFHWYLEGHAHGKTTPCPIDLQVKPDVTCFG